MHNRLGESAKKLGRDVGCDSNLEDNTPPDIGAAQTLFAGLTEQRIFPDRAAYISEGVFADSNSARTFSSGCTAVL